MDRAETIKKLRDRIPVMECIPGCTACCGHVPWSLFEYSRLTDAQKAKLSTFTMKCPFAYDGKCNVYEERPITCRIFAVTEGLPCPRGVKADEILDTETITVLMKEYQKTFFPGDRS